MRKKGDQESEKVEKVKRGASRKSSRTTDVATPAPLTTEPTRGRGKRGPDKGPRKPRRKGAETVRTKRPVSPQHKPATPVATMPGRNGGTLNVGGSPGRTPGTPSLKRLLKLQLEREHSEGKTNGVAIVEQTVKLAVQGSPYHIGLIFAADESLTGSGGGNEADAIFDDWDDEAIYAEAADILINEGLVRAI